MKNKLLIYDALGMEWISKDEITECRKMNICDESTVEWIFAGQRVKGLGSITINGIKVSPEGVFVLPLIESCKGWIAANYEWLDSYSDNNKKF